LSPTSDFVNVEETYGSHAGPDNDYNLGCDAILFGANFLKFQRIVLPPSPNLYVGAVHTSEMYVTLHQAMWCHIPKDSNLC
jgi:hypothetical protein